MAARTDLFEVAFAAIDEADATRGARRQALIADAIRLFHLAQAVEADKAVIATEPRSFVQPTFLAAVPQ